MATIPITTTAQREFLEAYLAFAAKLNLQDATVTHHTALVASAETERARLGAIARREIVRQFPAADGPLEAQLERVAVTRDEEGVITAFLTNDEAVGGSL